MFARLLWHVPAAILELTGEHLMSHNHSVTRVKSVIGIGTPDDTYRRT